MWKPLDPAKESLLEIAGAVDAPVFDVLHFTGHSDANRSGLWVFTDSEPSESNRVELGTRDLRELADGLHVRLLVLAACGTDFPDQWSIAQNVFQGTRVTAVVAMRNVVTNKTAAQFFRAFYDRLLLRVPVEEAFAHARGALDTADRGLPQLFLKLGADTRVWPPEQPATNPVAVANPIRHVIQPNGVIRVGAELWQLGTADGRLEAYDSAADDLDVVEDGTSLAVAADARAAVALRDDAIDAAWIIPRGRDLELKRPGWFEQLASSKAVPLPATLQGQNARVLAVSVLHGTKFRILVATTTDTWRIVLSPNGWGAPILLAETPALAALDTLPQPTIARAEAPLTGSAAEAFGRTPRALALDMVQGVRGWCAAVLTAQRKVVLATQDRGDAKWSRRSVDDAPGVVIGIGLVRQVSAATPELLLVTSDDGEVRVLVRELSPSASVGAAVSDS
ncbi:CHAT domain-containing protein [Microbacterium sp. P5_E9]